MITYVHTFKKVTFVVCNIDPMFCWRAYSWFNLRQILSHMYVLFKMCHCICSMIL